ncbi:hypothetical protein LRP67_19760 [Nocardioides sp. cx-169]|uniref:hypothetical protein n=1 Tax=Nocardioides sp. cx-169 TaxID=2899080 RepID=UPI001E44FE3C|nr:hypothetical protein [Nocardioides sp. cx-169]MCD4536334.1 hypothetical protein [Nocardioides sp. cx-169]
MPTSRPAASNRAGLARADLGVVSPLGRPPARALVVCLLLLVSSVAWRKGSYFSGGVDAVVMAKAALSLVALAAAATAPARGTPWARLRVGPLPLLGAYLAVTTVGAALYDSAMPTMVLAARLLILAATAVCLVHAFPAGELLSALTCAMLLLAGFASVTGLGSLASSGRLYGGVPPLNANEISLLVSVPLLCILWRCVHRYATWRDLAAIAPCLGVIWLTGTRTGLVALALAALVLVLMAPRIPVPMMCAGLLAIPSVLGIVFLTPVVNAYATRGDSASLLTLNSRTVAWHAAFNFADTWPERVLGVGLAVKRIPVSAMYRSDQILDSTWVSAYVQAGVAGTALLLLLVLATGARVAATRPPMRSLSASLLLLLLGRSFLESGVLDATPSGITFLLVALALQPRPPQEEP